MLKPLTRSQPPMPPLQGWALLADVDPQSTRERVLDLTHCADTYAVTVQNKVLCTANGAPWDTDGKEAKFVMCADATIFGSVKFRESGKSLHHTSFTRAPVAAAGLANVRAGHLLYVLCDSGHYQPTVRTMAQFLGHIRAAGACLDGVQVGLHPAGDNDGDDFTWLSAADTLALDGDTPIRGTSAEGPDRSGQKSASALSRTSTRSSLSSSSVS